MSLSLAVQRRIIAGGTGTGLSLTGKYTNSTSGMVVFSQSNAVVELLNSHHKVVDTLHHQGQPLSPDAGPLSPGDSRDFDLFRVTHHDLDDDKHTIRVTFGDSTAECSI